MKYILEDETALSIVPKGSPSLPPPIRKMLREKGQEFGTGYEHAMILDFPLSGEESYQPIIDKDIRRKSLFNNLKASERIKSRSLWLDGKEESHRLMAYLIANDQSLMAMTDVGILNSTNVEEIRNQYRQMVTTHHGRE